MGVADMTDKMPFRKVGPAYQLDANRINARQKDSVVNQLERWHDAGVIFLEMSRHAFDEAGHGSCERREKTDKYTWTSTNDTIGGEFEFRRKIESIVFPHGASSENQKNDVWNLFTAHRASATLITADGGSRTQPGGILGNSLALAGLGIRVLASGDAVKEIKRLIHERDRTAREVAANTGMPLPRWVGQDDPTDPVT
jgi:hypothetical protein